MTVNEFISSSFRRCNDVTWSIIWRLIIFLAGVLYVVVYILGIDEREEHGSHDTPKQEELLQLPSDGD